MDIWSCLFNWVPETTKRVADSIYNECATQICPLLGRCCFEYFQRFGPNPPGGQPNNGQPGAQPNAGQTEDQTSARQSGGQTNARQSGGQTEDQTSTRQPGGQATPGQSSSGCHMIFASELTIEPYNGSWELVQYSSDPRFTEVVVLLQVWFFYIKTSMNFLALSANTKYGAYLIFEIKRDSEGLNVIMNTSVSVGTKEETKSVCLKPTRAIAEAKNNIGCPGKRLDGWLELELGQFDCDIVTGKDAVIIIQETKRMDIKKAGLIVAGIEIRAVN